MSVNTINQIGQQNTPQTPQETVRNSNSTPLLRIKSDAPTINDYFNIQGDIKDFAHFGDKYDNKAQDLRMEKVCQVRNELQKLTDKYSNFNFNLALSLPEPNPKDFGEGKAGFEQYKDALKEWGRNCKTKFKEIENMLKHISPNNNCVITIGNNNNVLVHIKNEEAEIENNPQPETIKTNFMLPDFSRFGDKAEKALKETSLKIQNAYKDYGKFLKDHPNMKFNFENSFPLPNTNKFDEGNSGFNSYMKALNDWAQNCKNHLNHLNKIAGHIDSKYECVVTIGDNNNLLFEIPSETPQENNISSLAARVNGNDNNIALVADTTQSLETQSYSKATDENSNTAVFAEVSDLNKVMVGDVTGLEAKDKIIIESDNNFNNSLKPEDLTNSSSLIVGDLEIKANEVYIGGQGNNSTDLNGNAVVPNNSNNPIVIAGNLDIEAETVVINEKEEKGDINPADLVETNGQNNNIALVLNQTHNTDLNTETIVANLTNTNIDGDAVILGDNNFVSLSSKATDEEVTPEPTKNPEPAEPKKYQVKKGDFWYKVLKEEYGLAEGPELDALVKKIKTDYYEANKVELIKQGYNSPKSGFFPKVGDELELPKEIEIDGKQYKLV